MTISNKKIKSKIDRRTRQLRDRLWPDAASRIWEYDKSIGWLNVPRSMPIIMRIMDSLSKGQPVSSTYFELWCRTYNNGFVTANQQREMAFFSGFDGERAQRTWASRIKKLKELDFIDCKEGPSGAISYILIENPYMAIKKLRERGEVSEQMWNALVERMVQIGASDLDMIEEDESQNDVKNIAE